MAGERITEVGGVSAGSNYSESFWEKLKTASLDELPSLLCQATFSSQHTESNILKRDRKAYKAFTKKNAEETLDTHQLADFKKDSWMPKLRLPSWKLAAQVGVQLFGSAVAMRNAIESVGLVGDAARNMVERAQVWSTSSQSMGAVFSTMNEGDRTQAQSSQAEHRSQADILTQAISKAGEKESTASQQSMQVENQRHDAKKGMLQAQ